MADELKKLKSLAPDENEQQALKEKQANIDAVAPQKTTAPALAPIVPPAPFEKVNQGPYGSRPGEVLYKIDSEGNISPLQAITLPATHQTAGPTTQREQTKVKPIIPSSLQTPMVESAVPIYDDGGDVTVVPNEKKPTMEVHGDESKQKYSDSQQVKDRPKGPGMPKIELTPIYDNGGEVDVNDGQHQLAVLQNGERVLTPEETAVYKKEHPEAASKGAPADFPGRVLPNPKGLKPILDTNIKLRSDKPIGDLHTEIPTEMKQGENIMEPILNGEVEPERTEPVGAKLSTDNTPVQDASGMNQPQNASLRPYSQVLQDKANEHVAKMQPIVAKEQPKADVKPEEPKLTGGHILAQQWALRNGFDISGMKKPEALGGEATPVPEAGAAPTTPAQPGLKPIQTTASAESPLTGKKAFQQKMQDYKTAYQEAMDMAAKNNDPQYAEQAGRIKEAMLAYEKAHGWGNAESAHPGILGKLGHIGERVAARTPFAGLPAIVSAIPGSEGERAREATAAQEQTKEGATEGAEATASEAKGMPKLLGGEGNTAVAPDGTRYQRYEMADHTARWAKEGEIPTIASSGTPPAGSKQEGAVPTTTQPVPTIGNQPNLADNPVVKNSLPSGTVVGKPVTPKEGETPATGAQIADVNTRLKNNPYVSPEAAQSLQFPEGYKPTQNDVKERLANIKEIEDATRTGKQDQVMNDLRKLQEENQKLMTQAHLADMEDKHQQATAKEAMNASVSLAGIYAQENYKDEVDKWHKSGNFAKDSGLITEIVDKEKGDKGAFSSVLGDALVGSIFGPEGTAIGTGVGALTGMFAAPANGYLDTLKKQGISQEGYDAMQAYFNALPARMAYEISVQGVSASALRNAEVIRKVMNTVPPPNTPQDVFDPNFERYYRPMDVLTRKKVELTAPKGYVPPKKEDIYPPKETPSKTERPAGVPEGATKLYRDANKNVVGYALDGKYHSLAAK